MVADGAESGVISEQLTLWAYPGLMPSDDPVVIATDGSCLSNPGPGGWAWATSDTHWSAGGHRSTTNNLMELRAVYEALGNIDEGQPILIQTDSEYVINVFTKWLAVWKSNGWRTSNRKPVLNQRAIQLLEERLARHDVRWEHVKGHAGHELNEYVDDLARAAATAVRDGRPVPKGPGYANVE